MKWKVLVTLLVVGGGACFLLANRYSVVGTNRGAIYKTDRLTGRTWLIVGVDAIEVVEESDEEKAIALTKSARGLLGGEWQVDTTIRTAIEEGSIATAHIIGWSADDEGDGNYQVRFTWLNEGVGDRLNYAFRVHVPTGIVRRVPPNYPLLDAAFDELASRESDLFDEPAWKKAPLIEEERDRLLQERDDRTLEEWRELAAGSDPQSEPWFEAKFHIISLLLDTSPLSARAVMDQLKQVNSDSIPQPWAARLRALDRRIVVRMNEAADG